MPRTGRPVTSTDYSAVHERLRRRNGRAAEHACIADGCERSATQWAWQRTGLSTSGLVSGVRMTWGLDLDAYAPMCTSHARMLDMGGTLTHCPNGHERATAGTYSRDNSCAQCHRQDSLRRYHARPRVRG